MNLRLFLSVFIGVHLRLILCSSAALQIDVGPVSNATRTTAISYATLTSTNGSTNAVNLVLYYGTSDGSTNTANWSASNVMASVTSTPAVTITNALSGLAPASQYYCRWYAIEGTNSDWAPGTNFSTLAGVPTSGVVVAGYMPVMQDTNGVVVSPTNFAAANGLSTTNADAILQAQISSNDIDIASAFSQVSSNDLDITSLQARTGTNEVNINSLQLQVGSNDVDIANLNSNITAHIESNAVDHASYQSQLSSNLVSSTNLAAQLAIETERATQAEANWAASPATQNVTVTSTITATNDGRAVFGSGLSPTNISVESAGASQLGSNAGTMQITGTSHGSRQTGLVAENSRMILSGGYAVDQTCSAGDQAIVSNSLSYCSLQKVNASNPDTLVSMRNSDGAMQIGWADTGARMIMGSQFTGAKGSLQLGVVRAGGAVTNLAWGAIQLFCIESPIRGYTTSDADGSILIGAGVASNKYSITVGDGQESHGEGSGTFGGGVWSTNSPAADNWMVNYQRLVTYVAEMFSPGKSTTNSWVDAGGITNRQVFGSGLLTSWTTNGVEL